MIMHKKYIPKILKLINLFEIKTLKKSNVIRKLSPFNTKIKILKLKF